VALPATDDTGAPISPRASAVGLDVRKDQSDQAAAEMAVRATVRMIHEQRLPEAMELARDATVRFPNSVVLHLWLGDVYERLGQRSEASRIYSRALAIVEGGQEYPMPFRQRDIPEAIRSFRAKIAQLQ